MTPGSVSANVCVAHSACKNHIAACGEMFTLNFDWGPNSLSVTLNPAQFRELERLVVAHNAAQPGARP